MVTNFEVALIKKLWRCSLLSRTLREAVPSPPPSPGGVRLHVGYLGIAATFQLVCHIFLSITFAFSCYSRSMEAHNCRSDRRETGTQLVQIGKPKTASNSKSENPLIFFAKTENQMLKYGKSANRNEHQNRKTDLENSQNSKNRKSQMKL